MTYDEKIYASLRERVIGLVRNEFIDLKTNEKEELDVIEMLLNDGKHTFKKAVWSRYEPLVRNAQIAEDNLKLGFIEILEEIFDYYREKEEVK